MSLTLSWNEITDISALASCGKLENVWLGFNRIKDISALASCKRLRYLDVGVNQITDISVLAHFRKLWGVSVTSHESGTGAIPRTGNRYNRSIVALIFV